MIGIKPMPKFDAQPLLTLVKRVEAVPEKQFRMDVFTDDASCGTVGCMVGWDAIGRLSEKYGDNLNTDDVDLHCWVCLESDSSREAYSISANEWRWLFSFFQIDGRGYRKSYPNDEDKSGWSKDRNLNRVRKLIWWKLRKQEIMANDDARHIEGDWNLAAEAKGELCGA